MIIKSAEFIKSASNWKDCPPGDLPEYAFLGRSNVGKSSLINMVTRHGKLAKTSATPGKTRLINHFLINSSWYLADLPGYGFAKVPVAVKKKWEKVIQTYLLKRRNLLCSFILIDSRHEPLRNDIVFLEWFGTNQLPFCLVFTKADKLSESRLQKHLETYKKTLSEQWDPLPPYILSSGKTGRGRDEILGMITDCNKSFNPA